MTTFPAEAGSAVRGDDDEQKSQIESFRLLFDSNPVAMWVFDRETLRFLAVNDAALARYGYSREQFLTMKVTEMRPAADRERFAQFLRALEDSQLIENIGQHCIADGSLIDVAVASRTLIYGGRKARLTAIHDITMAKRVESELRQTQKFLDAVIEHVPAPILVKDMTVAGARTEWRYTLVNRAVEVLFGVPRETVIGKTVSELYPKERADFIIAENNEALHSPQPITVSDHAVYTPANGVRIATATTVAIRSDDQEPKYLVTVLQDVTERKRSEQRIAHMAHHDHMTDLPNRTTFNDAMTASIDLARKSVGQFTVLSLDLDGFKEANDTYGHLVGDALLCEVARRLVTAASGSFVARIGGDEFAIIVQGDAAMASSVAGRVLSAFRGDIRIEDRRIKTGVTIGAAVYPKDGDDAKALISNADIALYRAKTEVRGSLLFFDAEMGERVRERRVLQDALRAAIERREFLVHYQPQKKITGEVIGFEALARWRHPVRGLVPPAEFIPIAEESGLINQIGEIVLREACREAATWAKPLTIAVNVSPLQFRTSDLTTVVHETLMETGLAPSRLELEITENVFIDDFSRAISILSRLKTLGVRIALDDFGSGYSSLSYLHSFSFDKIKIDRTFIGDLEDNRHSMAIVRAVIDLGHSLSIPVLAEGVENAMQHAMLLGRGCDEVQGYLIGRPQAIEAYGELVGRGTKADKEVAIA
ncbi:MAG TPA: EAL domain-containing protein [Pseudolabrys sp.]|nr:EAL domain-containing protein [Pseudolabrys sp.]